MKKITSLLILLLALTLDAHAKPGPEGEALLQKFSGIFPLYLSQIRYQISNDMEYLSLDFILVKGETQKFKDRCLGFDYQTCKTRLGPDTGIFLYPANMVTEQRANKSGSINLPEKFNSYGSFNNYIFKTLNNFVSEQVLGKNLFSYQEYRDVNVLIAEDTSITAKVEVEEWSNGSNSKIIEIMPSTNQSEFKGNLSFLNKVKNKS